MILFLLKLITSRHQLRKNTEENLFRYLVIQGFMLKYLLLSDFGQQEVFNMKPYSENQKYEVLLKYLCGHAPQKIADKVGVHRTTVYRWIADWKEDLERHTLAELPIQDMVAVLTCIAELEKQITEQNRIIAIIHESHILQSVPLKHRLDMAMQYLNTYPVKQLCHVFEIKPSSLYYHIAVTHEETKYQQKEKLLRSEITRAFEDSGRRFGAERIRLQLRNHGIRTSKKRIIRLMKQMGLYNESSGQPYYPMPGTGDPEDTQDVQIL